VNKMKILNAGRPFLSYMWTTMCSGVCEPCWHNVLVVTHSCCDC